MRKIISKWPFVDRWGRRPPFAYAAARNFLDRFESLDADHRAESQAELLDKLLERARRTEYYGTRRIESIEDAPMISSTDVRSNPAAFEVPTLLPKSRATTSGTSGTPLQVTRSLRSVVFEQAVIDWVIAKAGHDFTTERVAVFRGANVKPLYEQQPPYWQSSASGRILIFSTNHLSGETFPDFHAKLAAYKPTILYAYPSAVESLARYATASRRRLTLPLVVTSSETFSVEARDLVEQSLSARTVDYYGQAERSSFAYSLQAGEYRFVPSYARVELIPTVVGETDQYEIIGTNLHNSAQILLRYRSGDSVKVTGRDIAQRSVGLGLETFAGIEGRLEDVLQGRDGRTFIAMNHIPWGLDQYGRFQLVQLRPNHVLIQMEGADVDAKKRPEVVIERARVKLPPDFEVEIAFVDQLTRTAAGKTPFILRES